MLRRLILCILTKMQICHHSLKYAGEELATTVNWVTISVVLMPENAENEANAAPGNGEIVWSRICVLELCQFESRIMEFTSIVAFCNQAHGRAREALAITMVKLFLLVP